MLLLHSLLEIFFYVFIFTRITHVCSYITYFWIICIFTNVFVRLPLLFTLNITKHHHHYCYRYPTPLYPYRNKKQEKFLIAASLIFNNNNNYKWEFIFCRNTYRDAARCFIYIFWFGTTTTAVVLRYNDENRVFKEYKNFSSNLLSFKFTFSFYLFLFKSIRD